MRYKLNKHSLISKMVEYQQSTEQRIEFMIANISVLMSREHFKLFNLIAHVFGVYYMLLTDAFELLRLNYSDYLIIIQSTPDVFIFEIRKKPNCLI